MLCKPSIYLETTMFSFYYEERELPEYQEHKAEVRAVFALIKTGKFDSFTSDYTLQELRRTKNAVKRDKMLI